MNADQSKICNSEYTVLRYWFLFKFVIRVGLRASAAEKLGL